MYFVTLGAGVGDLLSLTLVPMETRRFRLQRASPLDAEWLTGRLDAEAQCLGARVISTEGNTCALQWK